MKRSKDDLRYLIESDGNVRANVDGEGKVSIANMGDSDARFQLAIYGNLTPQTMIVPYEQFEFLTGKKPPPAKICQECGQIPALQIDGDKVSWVQCC